MASRSLFVPGGVWWLLDTAPRVAPWPGLTLLGLLEYCLLAVPFPLRQDDHVLDATQRLVLGVLPLINHTQHTGLDGRDLIRRHTG